MNTLSSIFSIILMLAFTTAAYPKSPTLDTVLEQLIRSYGGEKNVRKLENAVQKWDMVALMSKRHGTDVRHIRMPDQLMVKLTYPDKVEKRELYGNDAWVIFDGGRPSPATPAQRDAMRLQLMRLYSPLVLSEKSDDITLTIDGDLCALSLVEHGVQADYLVNMDTWRIEKAPGSLPVAASGSSSIPVTSPKCIGASRLPPVPVFDIPHLLKQFRLHGGILNHPPIPC